MNAPSLVSWPYSWWEQLLLKRAPQQDAYSPAALAAALLMYLLVDLAQVSSGSPAKGAWAVALTDTAVTVIFAAAVLSLAAKTQRLVQTLTALAGTGALLGLLGLPLIWQVARTQEAGAAPTLLAVGWVLLVAWSVVVQAHIFRHALSTRFGYGLLLAVLHSLIAVSVLSRLFPGALGQAAE